MGPAARQLVEEHKLDASAISGTGKDGRITKEDIVKYMKNLQSSPPPQQSPVHVRTRQRACWSLQRACREAGTDDPHACEDSRAVA